MAVVRDPQRHGGVLEPQLERDLRRRRMADGVGDRLLPDAQQLVVDLGRVFARRPDHRRHEPDARVADRPLAELAQHRRQVGRLEQRRAQVGDRLACVAHVGLHVTPDAEQLLLRRRRGRVEVLGDGVELQRDADQALEQRVVDLAAQPRAFRERQRELLPDQAQPDAPRAPDHQQSGRRNQRREPPRLIERGLDREAPRDRRRLPRAVLAAGVDLEAIGSGRQVGIESRAPGAGIDPRRVDAFQPVAKADAIRGRERQRRCSGSGPGSCPPASW